MQLRGFPTCASRADCLLEVYRLEAYAKYGIIDAAPAQHREWHMRNEFSSLADLGREVARLRKARGLTQKQLRALAGMGQSTLARFETGQVAEFGTRKLLRLLEVLGHGLTVSPERPTFTLDDALRERRSQADESVVPLVKAEQETRP